jgi:DNA-binding transcriptional ArsR family regulator
VNTLAKDWTAVGSALGEIEVIPPQALRWTEEAEETEEIDETDEREDVEGVVWGEIRQAVDECRLLAPQTSNKLLFQLARRVRGIEKRFHYRFAPILLRKIFDKWETLNHNFLRSGHDYFVEFCEKLTLVRQPYGDTLSSAIESARNQSPLVRVLVIRDPEAHLLASVCCELQVRAGREPFYLISRAYAKLTGRAHSTIASWLKAFRTLGIIELVEQGRPGYGSRYRYIC